MSPEEMNNVKTDHKTAFRIYTCPENRQQLKFTSYLSHTIKACFDLSNMFIFTLNVFIFIVWAGCYSFMEN